MMSIEGNLVRQVQPDEPENGRVFITVGGKREELSVMQVIITARNWQRALAHMACNGHPMVSASPAEPEQGDLGV